MSILSKYAKSKDSKGIFAIIKGTRLSGKSTLAGTLPGKSILAQAALLETGSNSAESLAKKLNNSLTVLEFKTVEELLDIVKEFSTMKDYANLYIDGITAITELKYKEPRINRKVNGGGNLVWDGFREIAEATEGFIEACKGITETTTKNIFLTLSLDPKHDSSGDVIELTPITKGQATLGKLERYGNNTVVIRCRTTDKGETVREILTKNHQPYTARIDSLLDDNNPGVLPADLTQLISLIKGV